MEQSKVHKEYYQMEGAIKSKEKELEEKVVIFVFRVEVLVNRNMINIILIYSVQLYLLLRRKYFIPEES
jgi:hypothetical protein